MLSVLPLQVWPFVPAQTLVHYAMHLLYGLDQLPMVYVLSRWVQIGRPVRPAR